MNGLKELLDHAVQTDRMTQTEADVYLSMGLSGEQVQAVHKLQQEARVLAERQDALIGDLTLDQRLVMDTLLATQWIKLASVSLFDVRQQIADFVQRHGSATQELSQDDEVGETSSDLIDLLAGALGALIVRGLSPEGILPHPVQRAEVLQRWTEYLESWASCMRAQRNDEIRAGLEGGMSPASVAKRVGVTKTYVLRVRDSEESERLAMARDNSAEAEAVAASLLGAVRERRALTQALGRLRSRVGDET